MKLTKSYLRKVIKEELNGASAGLKVSSKVAAAEKERGKGQFGAKVAQIKTVSDAVPMLISQANSVLDNLSASNQVTAVREMYKQLVAQIKAKK